MPAASMPDSEMPAASTPDSEPRETSRLGLGGRLRRAWLGYQRRLDEEMAAAGFDRRPPDGRVLRLCADDASMTVSQIGRHLGITRQGAAKIVNSLVERRYLEVSPSGTNGREKTVRLTPHAERYLTAHRAATRRIEDDLRASLGPAPFESLGLLIDALGADSDERVIDYLRRRSATDLAPNR
jgi:DNA-binding MarR family transcriptional regulator